MKKLIALLALMTTVSGYADDLVTLTQAEGQNLQIQVRNAISNANLRCTPTGDMQSQLTSVELGSMTRANVIDFLSIAMDKYTLSRPINKKGYVKFYKSEYLSETETSHIQSKQTLILHLNENYSFDTFNIRAVTVYFEGDIVDTHHELHIDANCTIVRD